jgi:chemotaxis protein CheD
MQASVRVQPGEFFATDRDVALTTVLGSCVAACVRDRVSGIGGMNHFMLPRARGTPGPASASARYGVNAMELLINEILHLGAQRQNLEAKVFGGGNVLSGVTMLNVGEMNAEFVCRFLREESIPVVASDLQGAISRQVRYFPASGRALVRPIGRRDDYSVLEGEARYGERLRQLPGGGDVELFA